MAEQTNNERPKTEDDIQEQPASTSQKNVVKLVLIVVVLLVLLSIVGIVLLGWIGGRVGEEVIEQATNSNITQSEDGISIETDDSELNISQDQELPDNFPNQVPIYSPASIASSARSTQNNEQFWSVTLTTSDSAQTVQAYYEDALTKDGWTTDSSFETGGLTNIGASNEAENLTMQLGILSENSSEETTITINVNQS